MQLDHYPYPKFIAHRGGGSSAPENTLAAFRFGMMKGFSMSECDVKLSKDHSLFLLHDDDLERTTNGSGLASHLTWEGLSHLDAGSWHSRFYHSEPLLKLESLIRFVLANDLFLDIEIKPNPNQDYLTGVACVELLHDLTTPQQRERFLFSSFSPESLRAVYDKDPSLSRALLVYHWHEDVWSVLDELECDGLITNFEIMDADKVQKCHQQDRFVMVYTVNDAQTVNTLLSYNVDSIITDNMLFLNQAV